MKVHVLFPAHVGSALGAPAEGVMVFPQLSVTTGGVGATANAGHATVEEPPGGSVIEGGGIVYVYTQLYGVPLQAVYVNVQVFVPPQVGFAPGTPADGVIGRPQLSVTTGGVGAIASDKQGTVDAPGAGSVTVGGLIVYVYTQL